MHLKTLNVEGYKNFGKAFQIDFNKGLNVLVGENGSGKSAIIDAIRLLLLEDEYGRGGIVDTDFHRPFKKNANRSSGITISALFSGLTKKEEVAFMPWVVGQSEAKLTLEVENKETNRGWFKRSLWGGVSRASMFEKELLDSINCIYLPPMRDAEAKLREGKGSRLARLLKNLHKTDTVKGNAPLEKEVREFNAALASDKTKVIDSANELIRTALKEAIGTVFGQDTLIQFSENDFNRIVESLRLVFYPRLNAKAERELFRSLEENSLGYNNLLYLATVLAELQSTAAKDDYLRILLIEEPESHLHPQLQIRLVKYLERIASSEGIQVIVTTHSPVLAAAVSLNTMIHLSSHEMDGVTATPIRSCKLSPESEPFISRWLDVTKSTLLFAKAVILVEGLAEALLIPELARLVLAKHNEKCDPDSKLPESLEDAGVAIINMNGIYFQHFMQLFCDLDGSNGKKLSVRCAGLTDKDPPAKTDEASGKQPIKPTPAAVVMGKNHALKLIPIVNGSANTRLYSNDLKTLEYDLAMTGTNLKWMLPPARELASKAEKPEITAELEQLEKQDWAVSNDWSKRADAAHYLLEHIDKGEYAQALAEHIRDESKKVRFVVPDYIDSAVLWACGKGK